MIIKLIMDKAFIEEYSVYNLKQCFAESVSTQFGVYFFERALFSTLNRALLINFEFDIGW